jgi:hypothetical protein
MGVGVARELKFLEIGLQFERMPRSRRDGRPGLGYPVQETVASRPPSSGMMAATSALNTASLARGSASSTNRSHGFVTSQWIGLGNPCSWTSIMKASPAADQAG